MQYATQRIDLDTVDENVHPAQVSTLVRSLLVVEGSEPRGERFESRVEVGDDRGEGEGVDERDAGC
jgi:hypothetical protein